LSVGRIAIVIDDIGLQSHGSGTKVGFGPTDPGADLSFEKIRNGDGRKNSNDSNNNEKFNEGEGPMRTGMGRGREHRTGSLQGVVGGKI
jgi:hypothetical protein